MTPSVASARPHAPAMAQRSQASAAPLDRGARAAQGPALADGYWVPMSDAELEGRAARVKLHQLMGGPARCAFVQTAEGLLVDHLAVHCEMARKGGAPITELLCVVSLGDAARVVVYLSQEFVCSAALGNMGNMPRASAVAVAKRCSQILDLPAREWDLDRVEVKKDKRGGLVVAGPLRLVPHGAVGSGLPRSAVAVLALLGGAFIATTLIYFGRMLPW
jgi:hypothetical protein